MREENSNEQNSQESASIPQKAQPPLKDKKGGKFFKRIPKEFLISPGGVILIFIALFFEILDFIIPGGSLTIEIIPDLIFAFLLKIIAGIPLVSSIIPFLIERIPILSDILPTWLIRMFI